MPHGQIMTSVVILSERRRLRWTCSRFTSWMRVRDIKHDPESSGTARKKENDEQQTAKQNAQWLSYLKGTLESTQSLSAKLEKLEQKSVLCNPRYKTTAHDSTLTRIANTFLKK